MGKKKQRLVLDRVPQPETGQYNAIRLDETQIPQPCGLRPQICRILILILIQVLILRTLKTLCVNLDLNQKPRAKFRNASMTRCTCSKWCSPGPFKRVEGGVAGG